MNVSSFTGFKQPIFREMEGEIHCTNLILCIQPWLQEIHAGDDQRPANLENNVPSAYLCAWKHLFGNNTGLMRFLDIISLPERFAVCNIILIKT
jgi:hypothetical protein